MRMVPGWTGSVAAAAVLMAASGSAAPAPSTPAPPAAPEQILLWPEGAPGAVGTEDADRPRLDVYRPAADRANGTAVIVVPGGGYGFLALGHEGQTPAEWLNNLGITAFVLHYRIAPRYHFPAPIQDGTRAMRLVRSRAAEWNLDSHRIGIWGFSAGGHLSSTVGTHFNSGRPDATDPVERASSRPDFMILAYPVITMETPYTHMGSRVNLLGEHPKDAQVEEFSNEKHVTKETPPAFLFSTSADTTVPSENSVLFYLALHHAGVPAELHVDEQGPHGVGLAPQDPILSSWPQRLADWLKTRGVLEKR